MSESTKSVGDKMEQIVAQHYESLGFNVIRNTMILSHEIDILASKYISGGTLYKIMIEAKHRSKNLGINEVTNFINTAQNLMRNGHIQSAVMVTNNSFSKFSQGNAWDVPGIKFMTLNELQRDLFNITESLFKSKIEYEASPIYKEYIPLTCKPSDIIYNHKDIASSILKFLGKPDENFVVLVGDFGSGKSTLMRKMFYTQSCRCLEDPSKQFPIFLRLGKLLQYSDLWSFVLNCLKDEQYISPPREIIESQLRLGRLMFFLDGFDEIHTGANASDRADYLSRLSPLLTSKSACILATRPTYFESIDEMKRLFLANLTKTSTISRVKTEKININRLFKRVGLKHSQGFPSRYLNNIVSIQALTTEDVLSYIRKFEDELKKQTSLNAEQILAKLFSIYDLSDLMSRPILLNMIIVTLIEAGWNLFGSDINLGPSSIYDLYTQMCVKRDYEKSKTDQILQPSSRLEVCRTIALSMLKQNYIEISPISLVDAILDAKLSVIAKSSKARRVELIERVLTDIRVCSFLIFTDDGGLRFAHKSYLEFFIAQFFIINWQKDYKTIDKVSEWTINKETVYFLGSYAREEKSIGKMILDALKSGIAPTSASGGLLRRIVFSSGALLENFTVYGGLAHDVEVLRIPISKSKWSAVDFRNVIFRGTILETVEIINCMHTEVIYDKVKFNKCIIRNENGIFNLIDCSIDRSDIHLSCDWIIKSSYFDNSKVHLSKNGWPNVMEITNSRQVILGNGLYLKGSGSIVFRECDMYSENLESWHDINVRVSFERVILCGVFLELGDVLAMCGAQTKSIRGHVRIEDCSGIIFTSDPKKLIDQNLRVVFSEKFPAIDLYDIETYNAQLAASATRKNKTDNFDNMDFDIISKIREKIGFLQIDVAKSSSLQPILDRKTKRIR